MDIVLKIILLILQIILCFAAGYAWGSIINIRRKFETLNIKLNAILDNNHDVVDFSKRVLNNTNDIIKISKAIQQNNDILIKHIANKK